MLLVKNEKNFIAFVQYTCNSGWCVVQSVEVVPKNDDTIDCKKIADKIMKKYKKDISEFFKDIEDHGSALDKVLVAS